MGCACEIQFCISSSEDASFYDDLFDVVENEVQRIESKFSRYKDDNVVAHINAGLKLDLDSETYALLQYAEFAYGETDGLFDITTGCLRRIWTFDGQKMQRPSQIEIEALKPFLGWSKVNLTAQGFQLPTGMEIDFGGIGKEYAIDRCAQLIANENPELSFLLNFGGDIFAHSRLHPWRIGIQTPDSTQAAVVIDMQKGGVATSGDAERFVVIDGVKSGHILNPKTCHPVEHAPRSVTVAAASCTEAGMISTFAMLNGRDAEIFLQDYKSWVLR